MTLSKTNHERFVVLLSGGQDSTTCLYAALNAGAKHVCAVSIWYGQRHDVELQAATDVLDRARVDYPDVDIVAEHVNVGRVLVGTSPLVSDSTLGQYDDISALPDGVEPTFVPGRNLLFLTIAANRAANCEATCVVTGLCEADFAGYYDCRREFVDAAEVAIAQAFVGASEYIEVWTPLMSMSKAQSVEYAQGFKGCIDALSFSHTCYAGSVPPCGKCHACLLRVRGFDEAGIEDPLVLRLRKTA